MAGRSIIGGDGGYGGDAMSKVERVNHVPYYRSSAYMTQQEFADSLGVSLRTVASWESGKMQPDIDSERKLYFHCAAYRIAYSCPICEVTR